MIYCKNCGFEITTGHACPKCGYIDELENNDVFDTSVIEDSSFEAKIYDTISVVDPGKGKGIAALVLGIVSIVFSTICCLSCAGFPSFITSIIGMVLASSAKKISLAAGYKNTNAKTGLILSVVSLIISIFAFVAFLLLFALYGASLIPLFAGSGLY